MNRYDIFMADFCPQKGHRQTGIRPCIILQSDAFNSHSSTIVVAPLTSTKNKVFPSEFLILPSHANGLTVVSRFLGHQIITLDKTYLTKKLGTLEAKYIPEIKEAIGIIFDLEDLF